MTRNRYDARNQIHPRKIYIKNKKHAERNCTVQEFKDFRLLQCSIFYTKSNDVKK